MGKRKDVIRVGDRVRIITPEVLMRVGYPLDPDEAYRIVEEKYSTKVISILYDMHGVTDRSDEENFLFGGGLLGKVPYMRMRTYSNVMRELAHGYLRAKNFGGTERRIYTTTVPEIEGRVFTVQHIKIHKTGIYIPGFGGYNYDGEYDYEPAYLSHVRTHKFVDIHSFGTIRDINKGTWIEVCHVEKVE